MKTNKRAMVLRTLLAASIVILAQHPSSKRESEGIKQFFSGELFSSATIGLSVTDIIDGQTVVAINPHLSVTPASVQKLVTTASSLALLGEEYRFSTLTGYTGRLDSESGVLRGDLIIRGGGDPALGSENFESHYGNIIDTLVISVIESGIKRIEGRIVADDSMFDYNPVPSKWVWEDLGNYYGAGAYGLSIFDNTFRLFLRTGERGSFPEIVKTEPSIEGLTIRSYLVAEGDRDRGYVFSAPYGNYAWISGTVPENRSEFILKASIPDPPALMATLLTRTLADAGIEVTEEPVTLRNYSGERVQGLTILSEIISPSLAEIVIETNRESVNLYAEHLIRMTGLEVNGDGSISSGIEAITGFLKDSEIDTGGLFMEDGSGVSPMNALPASLVTSLIREMVLDPDHTHTFINSLPAAGSDGTMKFIFRDNIFRNRIRAKTGSMTRVRGYAGIITTITGRNLAFCIIINNYSGEPSEVVTAVEDALRYLIITM